VRVSPLAEIYQRERERERESWDSSVIVSVIVAPIPERRTRHFARLTRRFIRMMIHSEPRRLTRRSRARDSSGARKLAFLSDSTSYRCIAEAISSAWRILSACRRVQRPFHDRFRNAARLASSGVLLLLVRARVLACSRWMNGATLRLAAQSSCEIPRQRRIVADVTSGLASQIRGANQAHALSRCARANARSIAVGAPSVNSLK